MPSSACQKSALRSEEHTSELQSHDNLVCRLLLEKTTARRSTRSKHSCAPPRPHVRPRPSPPCAPLHARDLVVMRKELVERDAAGLIFFIESKRTLDDFLAPERLKTWL